MVKISAFQSVLSLNVNGINDMYGLNCYLSAFICCIPNPHSSERDCIGDRVFEEVTKLEQVLGCVYPSKRDVLINGELDTDTQREDHMKTHGKENHLQVKDRAIT